MSAAAPRRRCIASGESLPSDQLIRFTVGPDGTLVPDLLAALPGRGLWVRASAALIDRAVVKGLFAKAARRKVTVDGSLSRTVEALLARRCTELLGLARRAGQAVAGFEKVRAEVAAGRAAILVAAADGAATGKDKLRRLSSGVSTVACLTVAELSLAMGRENVVHAALAPGGLAQRFLKEAARLEGLRGPPDFGPPDHRGNAAPGAADRGADPISGEVPA